MYCRCDEDINEVYGDAALRYAEHLQTVAEDRGQWLVRCPRTGAEWVKDFPLDPQASEWVGTCRLRRFPLTDPEARCEES